ncbi:MAG: patatin-like phospholipase family protein [Aquabacterium sp.]|uniref:patatin-like phospholipase family protein n=1 Tax=Aquabacterium sp. TaxID=1872578 RepID=UPI00271BABA5|nr:patatin-like phospholipase family protein [Aquabacterium sp.]MDO9002998.1 patatin-like phospholipase family protein [Aquabacterium sp.]
MNFAYASVEYGVGRVLGRVLSAALILVLAACSTRPPAPAPVAQAPVLAPVVIKPLPKPPKIGLALGGGAARGFAHIGVLQVLEEQGIKPDLVVGTSAGSLVAAIYAAGKTPAELESMAMTLDESTMTDWVFPGRSVMKGEALAKFVRGHTAGRQIEQMALPLGIVATDLNSGQPILFRRGDPGTAVRASSSVPAVFTPVRIAGREYVDGGLVSPIPVKYARQMGADLVIAVDISAIPEGQPTKGAVDILLQTFNIMGHSISQYELQDADVVMRPRLSGIGGGDFGNRRLSILAGREAALSVLQQLKEKIAVKTR